MLRLWTAITPFGRKVSSQYARSASVVSFNHDGMRIARVTTRKRRFLPVWHLLVFVYLFLLIRLIAVADAGAYGYDVRLEEMRQGTLLERAAAQIMGLDPLSRKLAVELRHALAVVNAHI